MKWFLIFLVLSTGCTPAYKNKEKVVRARDDYKAPEPLRNDPNDPPYLYSIQPIPYEKHKATTKAPKDLDPTFEHYHGRDKE